MSTQTQIIVEALRGSYDYVPGRWIATVKGGIAEGATATGKDLKHVLTELASVIELRAMHEGTFAAPQTCRGSGMVQIAPGVRGLKACPGCRDCRKDPSEPAHRALVVACSCSYGESGEMTRHAPLCAVTKAGLNS